MTAAQIFISFCLAFLGGIALNSLILVSQLLIWGAFVFGIALISVFWMKDKKVVVLGVCLAIFALGIYRHQMFERPISNTEYYQSRAEAVQSDRDDMVLVLQILQRVRARLGASIDNFLSPPQSALLKGIILGDTAGFSKEFKQKLNQSGTRHITAVSGMNVMILAEMLIGLGIILGMWRGQAFYFALAAIVAYIIMVGAPPSAIRAGIMGGIVLFAEKVGRLSQAQRLLILAAAIMLAFNPLLVKFDIGFQLSFLATFGIAKLSGWFKEKFARIPDILGLRGTLAMTFPAVIFTAPILAANFGQISLISVLANILIIPAIPLIFAFGFLASIVGVVFEPLGAIVFAPVWLFLTYIYKAIEISAVVPFAAMQVESFPWYFVVLYFTLLWWGIKKFKLER